MFKSLKLIAQELCHIRQILQRWELHNCELREHFLEKRPNETQAEWETRLERSGYKFR